MSTSGTYSFDPDVSDVVSEAFERCGKDADSMTAAQARSARRSLNFMFRQWSNIINPIWAMELMPAIPLLIATPSYALGTSTIDVMDAYIKDLSTGSDYVISRISRSDYNSLTNKLQTGRTTQYFLDRKINPLIYPWPIVEANGTFELYIWRLRHVQDVVTAAETLDVAGRFHEAVAAGLAARLAVKYAPDRVAMLGPLAAEAAKAAGIEDRQRVPTEIMPAFEERSVL